MSLRLSISIWCQTLKGLIPYTCLFVWWCTAWHDGISVHNLSAKKELTKYNTPLLLLMVGSKKATFDIVMCAASRFPRQQQEIHRWYPHPVIVTDPCQGDHPAQKRTQIPERDRHQTHHSCPAAQWVPARATQRIALAGDPTTRKALLSCSAGVAAPEAEFGTSLMRLGRLRKQSSGVARPICSR